VSTLTGAATGRGVFFRLVAAQGAGLRQVLPGTAWVPAFLKELVVEVK